MGLLITLEYGNILIDLVIVVFSISLPRAVTAAAMLQ